MIAKAKYRVDTYPVDWLTTGRQMVFEDRLDELGEQGWELVTIFIHDGFIWRIAKRTLWWRLWRG